MNTKSISVSSELKKLFGRYSFSPIDENNFKRSQTVDCSECKAKNGKIKRNCHWCNGTGLATERSIFVNSVKVYTAVIRRKHFMLMTFSDVKEWFSIMVLSEPYSQDSHLKMVPEILASATTYHWNGQSAGSAIRRVPETLHGLVYRTNDEKGDCFRCPSDIVKYLLSTLTN